MVRYSIPNNSNQAKIIEEIKEKIPSAIVNIGKDGDKNYIEIEASLPVEDITKIIEKHRVKTTNLADLYNAKNAIQSAMSLFIDVIVIGFERIEVLEKENKKLKNWATASSVLLNEGEQDDKV